MNKENKKPVDEQIQETIEYMEKKKNEKNNIMFLVIGVCLTLFCLALLIGAVFSHNRTPDMSAVAIEDETEAETEFVTEVAEAGTEMEAETETETETEAEFRGISSTEEMALTTYRNEVSDRLEHINTPFITDDERTYLVDHGYRITDGYQGVVTKVYDDRVIKYYYPVVMDLDGRVQVVSTNEGGYVSGIWGLGLLHAEEYIGLEFSNQDYSLVENDGTLELKKFRRTIAKMEMEGSYVGTSDITGYHYFLDGTDLYEVAPVKVLNPGVTSGYRIFKILVAKGVSTVLDCNYCYSSDMWACPLLWMEDGRLMVYCHEAIQGEDYTEEWLHSAVENPSIAE